MIYTATKYETMKREVTNWYILHLNPWSQIHKVYPDPLILPIVVSTECCKISKFTDVSFLTAFNTHLYGELSYCN